MKQLLLTIVNPRKIQIEVKDFLGVCTHSPQWIGDVNDWEIRSIHVYDNEKQQRCILGFLENRLWKAPEQIHGLSPKQIYDELKATSRNTKVAVGYRQGVNGQIESYDYGEVLISSIDEDYYIVSFGRQNNTPQITVNDLFISLDLSMFEKNDENSDIDNSENIDLLSKMTVVVQSSSTKKEGHPVTEVINVGDKILLICNQDITLG